MQERLRFLCDLPEYSIEQPFDLYGYPEQSSETQTNCKFEDKPVNVYDIRNNFEPSIESHGFMRYKHQSRCDLDPKHWETVAASSDVVTEYLNETVDLVRTLFQPVDVICFDWRVRLQVHIVWNY